MNNYVKGGESEMAENLGGYHLSRRIYGMFPNPDLAFSNRESGNTYAVLFGERRPGEFGDPAKSIYVRRIQRNRVVSHHVSGGKDLKSAIAGLTSEVREVVNLNK